MLQNHHHLKTPSLPETAAYVSPPPASHLPVNKNKQHIKVYDHNPPPPSFLHRYILPLNLYWYEFQIIMWSFEA